MRLKKTASGHKLVLKKRELAKLLADNGITITAQRFDQERANQLAITIGHVRRSNQNLHYVAGNLLNGSIQPLSKAVHTISQNVQQIEKLNEWHGTIERADSDVEFRPINGATGGVAYYGKELAQACQSGDEAGVKEAATQVQQACAALENELLQTVSNITGRSVESFGGSMIQ